MFEDSKSLKDAPIGHRCAGGLAALNVAAGEETTFKDAADKRL